MTVFFVNIPSAPLSVNTKLYFPRNINIHFSEKLPFLVDFKMTKNMFKYKYHAHNAGSSQCCMVGRQETTGREFQTGYKEKQSSTARDFPERLCSLHSWRFSRPESNPAYVTASCPLSRSLDLGPPDVPSNWNYLLSIVCQFNVQIGWITFLFNPDIIDSIVLPAARREVHLTLIGVLAVSNLHLVA